MKKSMLIVGLLFLFGNAETTFAQTPEPTVTLPKVTCYQSSGGGYWYNYCVHKVAASLNTDVLYYLHGLEGSEYEWEDSDYYSKVY